MKKYSFPPISNTDATILILGTMPSVHPWLQASITATREMHFGKSSLPFITARFRPTTNSGKIFYWKTESLYGMFSKLVSDREAWTAPLKTKCPTILIRF